MRVFQMQALLARYLTESLDVRVLELPERRTHGRGAQIRWALSVPGNAVYLVSKTAVRALGSTAAAILRWRTRGLCYDHVDEPRDSMRLEGADRHVCCSYAQFDAVAALPAVGARARLVLHAADLRLRDLPRQRASEFGCVYLGDPENTSIPPAIASRIDVLNARTSGELDRALPKLSGYAMHYAVRAWRPGQAGAMKPFVKGATAAALGAAILAARDTPDAERLLGADYPYFHEGDDPVPVFERAEAGFGGAEWSLALERMRALDIALGPETVAGQVHALVTELYDHTARRGRR
ncbi:hypothetical protein [Roseivivax isoporae]|nr:hypothetical protein [Roseivivax isoporae]